MIVISVRNLSISRDPLSPSCYLVDWYAILDDCFVRVVCVEDPGQVVRQLLHRVSLVTALQELLLVNFQD